MFQLQRPVPNGKMIAANQEAKGKKVEKSNSSKTTTNRTQPEVTFTCDECLKSWGDDIIRDFQGDPYKWDAPDPKQKIKTFSTFDGLKNHMYEAHDNSISFLNGYYNNQNRDFVCESCAASLECRHHLEHHIVIEHADVVNPEVTYKQFFDLYNKNQNFIDSFCDCDFYFAKYIDF